MAVLVGKQAPDFTATAVYGNNEIKDLTLSSLKGKYVVLFFYPLDFTFVCPSELIAFDHRLEEFKKRNVEVVGVSIDSQFSHLAWKNTPVNNGGIGQVGYPLVADIKHEIAQAFDVESAGGVAFRGSSLGRNIDEMLRMVDALQFTEEHGEVCPAGWSKGKAGMTASTEGVAKYLAENAKAL